MLRAIIVDDERLSVARLRQMLEERDDVEVVGEFTKPSELVAALAVLQPDVAFLDIEMPGRNGLELAAELLDLHEDMDIIFVTAYNQYALDAFRVNALDYLLKPTDPERLDRTLRRLARRKARLSPGAAPAETAGPAQVQCLGGFNIFRADSGKPVRFPTMKSEELFAFFLVHRDSDLSKWTICENLWPNHDPLKVENNLHTTVYRMKKTLFENGIRFRLEARKGLYRFELLEACDYARLLNIRLPDGRGGKADAEEAAGLLQLYRGPLFGDKDYPWCEPERERTSHLFASAAKAWAARHADEGEVRQARELLQLLLDKDPYDEEANERVLALYSASGDRASFFSHYRKWENRLASELGTVPSDKARKLRERMAAE